MRATAPSSASPPWRRLVRAVIAITWAGSVPNSAAGSVSMHVTPRSYTLPPPRRRCRRVTSADLDPDGQIGGDRAGRADRAGAHELERSGVGRMELEPIGDHSFTRLVCAERIMRRLSSAITAIGRSQSTWTPSRAASTA